MPPATPIDTALRARAQRVTPGGMTGHLSAAYLPPCYPQFFARGDGCRLWDVDGREFIDFMCSWGPNLLGHHHPEVEAAAARQRALGDCLNGPTALLWNWPRRWWRASRTPTGAFQKNGTDATTVCVTIAHAANGKCRILVASKAYHGSAPCCTSSPAGVTAEDRAHCSTLPTTTSPASRLRPRRATTWPARLVSAFKHDIGSLWTSR